ncbi:MAG: Rrf2 family transcriptional regulator [Fimbriimonadaceae bacterium]|nr:Rrf2 family transcriptional regulator [Fimbriimonadaceae bacterium]
MKFSAQEEYGLRCLLAVARQGDQASLTIPEISRMEGLTPSHVAKLMAILRKSGFVRSTRGQLGGYQLGMAPEKMIVKDVLESLGGRLYGDGFCERHSGIEPECVHEGDCLLRPLWLQVQHAVDVVLVRYTVADLLDESIPEPLLVLGAVPARKAR